jgi:hypothetical protein
MKSRKRLFVLLLLLLTISLTGWASTVTVTITGTVSSGTDVYANVFGMGNLAGQSFTLTYTFDDSLGTETSYQCSGTGAGYFSNISGTNTLSPGTATLLINGVTFPVGGSVVGYPLSTSATSYAEMATANCYYSLAGYGVQVGYSSSGYSGGSSVGYNSGFSIYPATGTALSTNYDWRSSIFSASLNPAYALPFNIDYSLTVGMSQTNYYAYGYLAPSTLTVSGPPCDTPISETTTFWNWESSLPGGGDYAEGVWHAVLNDLNSGATSNFNGFTVQETSPYNGTDTCHYTGSPYANMINIAAAGMPTTVTVAANGFNNDWDDSVGWNDLAVAWYRGRGHAPCGFTIYQQMSLQCTTGGPYYNYDSVHTLQGTITSSTVSSSRAGKTETH